MHTRLTKTLNIMTSHFDKPRHIPVLMQEVIDFLNLKVGEVVIDGTVGGGGHSIEILRRIGPSGMLIAMDWSSQAVEAFKEKTKNDSRVTALQANFADIARLIEEGKLPRAHGVLLDLGFSSIELEGSQKGFSFLKDEPLKMVYDDNREGVDEILKTIKEEELEDIIRTYGEERFAGRIAYAIKEAVKTHKILTSGLLAEVVSRAVPRSYEKGRIHPATRTFMALRIYANDELENLKKFLESVPSIIEKGGRVIVISFHSLEDRLVKNYFRDLVKSNEFKFLTKKPIQSSFEEVKMNPRARSAKLRAIIKL